jgi:hypothetical protein
MMTLYKIIHDTILHYRRLYNTTQRYATLYDTICTIYNMSGRVVSDIKNLKNDSSYEFIGEVILKINVV